MASHPPSIAQSINFVAPATILSNLQIKKTALVNQIIWSGFKPMTFRTYFKHLATETS
uniref:Uncharacterized protein n=1 Tax=Arion vulgaris TaxID=1028688 RepID=A0A0B7BS44_9EUPU